MKSFATMRRIATVGILGLLASCGGGGGGDDVPPPAPTNQPPASASQDVPGFIAYLKTVVPTMPDASEPLDVTAFVAPTSDTAEPDVSI